MSPRHNSYDLTHPIIRCQQCRAFGGTLSSGREHERERPQDVIELGAAQPVQMRHKRIDLIAQALTLYLRHTCFDYFHFLL